MGTGKFYTYTKITAKDKVLSVLLDENGNVDFNRLRRIPADLRIAFTKNTLEAIVYYLTNKLTDSAPLEEDTLKKNENGNIALLNGQGMKVFNELKQRTISEDEAEQLYTLGRRCFENYEKYGFYTWYSWVNRFWNSISNAFDTEKEGDSLSFSNLGDCPEFIYSDICSFFPYEKTIIESHTIYDDIGVYRKFSCVYGNLLEEEERPFILKADS